MKTTLVLSLLLFLSLTRSNAGEIKVGTRWPELRTTTGQMFWDVKFTFVSPREVRFMHTGGVGSMPLNEVVLPEDVTVTASSPPVNLGPVEAMMTAEERKNSGIAKLSHEEQAVLAKWLQHTASNVLKEGLEKQWAQPSPFRLPATASATTANGTTGTAQGAAEPLAAGSTAIGSEAVGIAPSPQGTTPPPAAAALPPVNQEPPPPASPALLPPPKPIASPTTVPAEPPASATPAEEVSPSAPVVQAAR